MYIRHSNLFCREKMNSSLTNGLIQILWTWWAFQNLIKLAKFVAYEQNVIVYIFLLNFVMSFASAADHQASSAIVSKQTFYVKNLYTITFCSYATQYTWFIKFWSDNHVPWTIWHLFLGYRGISIIRGKIVAISKVMVL